MSDSFDPIKALTDAGIPVDQAPEKQRELLASLSPEEVQTIVNIQKRMGGTSQVSGQASPDFLDGFGIF